MRTLALALSFAATGMGFRPPADVRLDLRLPLGRVAYQTNEWVDLSVLRSSAEALPAADLELGLLGEDGNRTDFLWPLAATGPGSPPAALHLRLNARLLRPGAYAIEASAYGVTARQAIEIYSHVRKSTFRLIDWSSRAKGPEQRTLGQESLGFNLLYASYGGLSPDDSIRGGLDYMWCCTMGGGHQMDLRMECDWSDPYVLQGGTARVARQALRDRTRPNCLGVHFYDEPGLTWWKHPKTGEMTPHNIPAQDRSYRSAFGREPLQYAELHPDRPEEVARWSQAGRWKLSFMDAAWKHAENAVSQVDPRFLSVTQSVYGWSAYADGYYFNVARSLPVISGHGGYDDYGGGYYNPLYTFEMGRIRELRKPNWYLPTWAGNIPSERYRLEQYEAFIFNLQGMAKPPDIQVHRPESTVASEGVVETNLLMTRLGTVFSTLPVTRPPVAVLYSMSQNLHAQTLDRSDNYEGAGHGRERSYLVYLAGLRLHTPILPVVEEEVLDGTLAREHRAVVLAGIDRLDPAVVSALEAYAASGGAVLVSDDCKVAIKGETRLGLAIDRSYFQELSRAWRENRKQDHYALNRAGRYLKEAEPVARALGPKLEALGIRPVYECDNPEIIASRQGSGDVDYFFAVNASYDQKAGGMNSIKPATATIRIPGNVYDAVLARPAVPGLLRFGPGQMRAWARTARPIGEVQVLPPAVRGDFTQADDPLHLEIGALVNDDKGRVLDGSIPVRITVTDPLGQVRYDLFRATDRGIFRMSLPLAANDPGGDWTVAVRDLLSGRSEGSAKFSYRPAPQCGALAGAVSRAITFGEDRQRIYRFFRTFQDVTLVPGSGESDRPAADRLAEILKPWGIRARIIPAQEAALPRSVAPEEMATWCGLHPGKLAPGQKPGAGQVGFALAGPVVLLGTPEDHPILKFAVENDFLPYKPHKSDFPGRARGYLSWQRDLVGYGQESIAVVAYDPEGMAEAVGSLFEAQAGLDPLLPLGPPRGAAVRPARESRLTPPLLRAGWTLGLPDGALLRGPFLLSRDGTFGRVDPGGKIVWQTTLEGGECWSLERAGERIIVGTTHRVLGFDESGKLLFEAPTAPQTRLSLAQDAGSIRVGTEDGAVTTFSLEGKCLGTAKGTLPPAAPPAGPSWPGRLVKRVATRGGLQAVAYWGGSLRLYEGGTIKGEVKLDDDICDLSWVEGTLVASLASGSVLGFPIP